MDTNVAGLNKVYCFTNNAGYNGKVVTITDGVNTWEKTIDSLSCVFMIPSMPAPAKKRYEVALHNGDATANVLYSRLIDLGFGDSVRIGLYATNENADKGYVQSYVASHAYSLPTASTSTKGGITVSDTASNGLYMSGEGIYLRTASTSQKGGIYVGKGLKMSGGVLSASVADSYADCHAKQTYHVSTRGSNVTVKATDSNFKSRVHDKLVVYIVVHTYAGIIFFTTSYAEVTDGVEIYGDGYSMTGSTEEYTPSFNSVCEYWYLKS